MKQLLEYLASIQEGPLADTNLLETLLAACWNDFAGSDAEGMSGYKLHGRMEETYWQPPFLTFIIERHGGAALGSTRAERHMWTLNVDKRTADCHYIGYRRVLPAKARFDAQPAAEEIFNLIMEHREDDRLKWNKDGSVRVQIGEILPEGSAFKQTLAGRRKRFREAVGKLLLDAGWQKVRQNVYKPPIT
jgi:hypothetical protein